MKQHSLCHGRIRGCPRRMLQSVSSSSSSISERAGGGREERRERGREGEAGDVKGFKLFRSPLP